MEAHRAEHAIGNSRRRAMRIDAVARSVPGRRQGRSGGGCGAGALLSRCCPPRRHTTTAPSAATGNVPKNHVVGQHGPSRRARISQ
jgi:hypothetical protein